MLRKRTVFTWSVWGVSVCPGPGWGLVWRSPEESGLGSVSPGTPYRFAWRTDRRRQWGREGGREGSPSVSDTTVATCVAFFLFFWLPSSSFWISPHISQETFEGTRSKTSSTQCNKNKRNSLTTSYQIVKLGLTFRIFVSVVIVVMRESRSFDPLSSFRAPRLKKPG